MEYKMKYKIIFTIFCFLNFLKASDSDLLRNKYFILGKAITKLSELQNLSDNLYKTSKSLERNYLYAVGRPVRFRTVKTIMEKTQSFLPEETTNFINSLYMPLLISLKTLYALSTSLKESLGDLLIELIYRRDDEIEPILNVLNQILGPDELKLNLLSLQETLGIYSPEGASIYNPKYQIWQSVKFDFVPFNQRLNIFISLCNAIINYTNTFNFNMFTNLFLRSGFLVYSDASKSMQNIFNDPNFKAVTNTIKLYWKCKNIEFTNENDAKQNCKPEIVYNDKKNKWICSTTSEQFDSEAEATLGCPVVFDEEPLKIPKNDALLLIKTLITAQYT